jgi:hypothetical protein
VPAIQLEKLVVVVGGISGTDIVYRWEGGDDRERPPEAAAG